MLNSYRLSLPLACPSPRWLMALAMVASYTFCFAQFPVVRQNVNQRNRRAKTCSGVPNVAQRVAECAPPNNATHFFASVLMIYVWKRLRYITGYWFGKTLALQPSLAVSGVHDERL